MCWWIMNSLYAKLCICLSSYAAVLAINSLALGRCTATNVIATILSAVLYVAYYLILDSYCCQSRSINTRKKRTASITKRCSAIFIAISLVAMIITMATLRMPYRLFPGPLPGILLCAVSQLLIQTSIGRPKSACLRQVKL